jgi:hypothetical protein
MKRPFDLRRAGNALDQAVAVLALAPGRIPERLERAYTLELSALSDVAWPADLAKLAARVFAEPKVTLIQTPHETGGWAGLARLTEKQAQGRAALILRLRDAVAAKS